MISIRTNTYLSYRVESWLYSESDIFHTTLFAFVGISNRSDIQRVQPSVGCSFVYCFFSYQAQQKNVRLINEPSPTSKLQLSAHQPAEASLFVFSYFGFHHSELASTVLLAMTFSRPSRIQVISHSYQVFTPRCRTSFQPSFVPLLHRSGTLSLYPYWQRPTICFTKLNST